MTPDRAKFNKEVEKGLLDRGVTIPIRAMTEQETAEQRIKIQADQIASLKRHIALKAENDAMGHDIDRAMEACKDHLYQLAAVEAERDALRLFGNKDCTAQAEEYLHAAHPKDAP